MIWTTERPKKSGWYWVSSSDAHKESVIFIQIDSHGNPYWLCNGVAVDPISIEKNGKVKFKYSNKTVEKPE